MDHRPGAAFRMHLAEWRDRQERMRGRVPQPDGCEAIGSILNGTRKPRWHTTRAGSALLLGSLALFAFAAALGARSPLLALIALALLTGLVCLFRVERSRRRAYGAPRPAEGPEENRDRLPRPATPVSIIADGEMRSDPRDVASSESNSAGFAVPARAGGTGG